MDGVSVTSAASLSTGQIVATSHICDQVAALLLIAPKVSRQAFLGESVEEVLAMAGWALRHEGEEGFDAGKILCGWAKKRGRGYWRMEESKVEGCRKCGGQGRTPSPSTNGKGREECSSCRGSEIELAPMSLSSFREVS